MLINFALDSIGTVVTSDKVSTDNHECTNLVSSDWNKRRRGFIAEHFIKPPVNITFQFPCSIQIYQVFVTPYVGQQLSSHIEVYTASSSSRAKNDMSSGARAKSCTRSANYEPTPNGALPTSGLTSSPLFYQVSKVSVFDYGRICFTNPKFGSETEFYPSTEDRNICLYRKTMQHFKKELMKAASHLSVRLVHTRHGSSVAVSSIDIWGLPAMSVPKPLKDNITFKFTSFIKPRPLTEKKKHICFAKQASESAPLSKEHNISKGEELSIPDEFIDPLTCEVMCIPMLLPCGKNVDLSTLNRFFDSEATYGRAPRDPFTGVVFSENSKPISNIALKSRIDQFLFKHRDDKATFSVARTVSGQSGTNLLGKRDVNGQRLIGRVSSLVLPNSESTRVPVKSIALSSTSRHSFPSYSNYSVLEPTGQKESDLKTYLFTETTTSVSTKPVLTATSSCAELSSQNESKSHEQKLKDSLNSALASILNSTPSQTKKVSISCPSNKPAKCSFCKKSQSEAVSLYNSPCNHTMCRQCLTTQFHSSDTLIKCGFCGTLCKREDFIRKHHH